MGIISDLFRWIRAYIAELERRNAKTLPVWKKMIMAAIAGTGTLLLGGLVFRHLFPFGEDALAYIWLGLVISFFGVSIWRIVEYWRFEIEPPPIFEEDPGVSTEHQERPIDYS